VDAAALAANGGVIFGATTAGAMSGGATTGGIGFGATFAAGATDSG